MEREIVSSTLSIVIPITKMQGRLQNLTQNLTKSQSVEFEIVIVHDEQDSETQRELEDLVAQFELPEIQLVRKTFGSPGLARNCGIELATGDWITFWDSDDLVSPRGYLDLVRYAEKTSSDVGIGGIEIYRNNKIRKLSDVSKVSEDPRDLVSDLAYLPAFTRMVFRRSAFNKFEFSSERLGEDLVFLANTNFLDHKIYLSSTVLYQYHLDIVGQATSRKDLDQDLIQVLKKFYMDIDLRTERMRHYLILQILRLSLTLAKKPKNFATSSLIVAKVVARYPILVIRSLLSILRRRREFRIR